MTNTYQPTPPPKGKSVTHAEFAGMTNDQPFDDIVMLGEDPDNFYPGIRYEFSIAPAEQRENSIVGERSSNMHDSWTIYLATILGGVATWELITECSTPKHGRYLNSTLNRIHFHGYITFINYGEFIGERAHFLSRHCTFKFSNLREQIWKDYISKQMYCMEPWLGKRYRLTSGPPPLCVADKVPTRVKPKVRQTASVNERSQQCNGLRIEM